MFGLYAPGHDVARLAYFALYALQHRGQESAGIATALDGHIMAMRDQGLVNQVFDEQRLRALQGDMAVGHVRYSTTGANSWENSQPVWRADRREVALGHNGNLTNAVELHAELREAGVSFRSTSDSEVIAALLSTHPAETVEEAVADVMGRMEGAYSAVVLTKDRVVAFRDPAGLRPLSLGMLGERYCVASESCAFDIIGAKHLRDVQPGEIVTLGAARAADPPGRHERARGAVRLRAHLLRAPDSRLGGQVLQVARGRMGEILASEAPGRGRPGHPGARLRQPRRARLRPRLRPAAGRRADQEPLRRSGRSSSPGQELRRHGLRMKFNPLPEVVAGRRLVVVDDSIVRGNTTRQIVAMLRDAGASEVHMRISAPPIRHPCHYGIDMSTREEMIAHGRTEAEIAAELGADSLAYLSLGGVYEAIRGSRETHCDACFTGEYPLAAGDGGQAKDAFEHALPTLRTRVPPPPPVVRAGLAPPRRALAGADPHGFAPSSCRLRAGSGPRGGSRRARRYGRRSR